MKTKLRLLSALAVVSLGHLHAQDTEAPLLTSITITPGSVDVSTGNQDVTVAVVVTDDDTGFSFGNLFLYTPGDGFVKNIYWNSAQRTSGDALSGTYVIPATIPQYAAPGTYRFDVGLWDGDFNRSDYGDDDIPLSNPADAEIVVANTGTIDSTAPQLVSISVSPSMIDTGTLSQIVTFTFTVTDDFSGFRSATVAVIDPSSNIQFNFSEFVPVSSATSGGPLNGTYQAALTMPQGSIDGNWTAYVSCRDEVGNTQTFLSPAGGSFTVMNTGGGLLGDLSDACDATQYTWTTAGDGDWFIQNDMTCDGVDAAQSGAIGPSGTSEMSVEVTGPGDLDFSWKVSSQENFDLLRVELDGSFEDEISGEVPWTPGFISIPAGPHTVTWIYEKDGGIDGGDDAGWVDKVKFVGATDTQDPVLQRIDITPSPVDISGGDVDVTITLEITDDFNGVIGGFVEFYDPSGENYDGTSYSSFDRISGDARCGVYEVQITINQSDLLPPDFYELGTWQAAVCVTEDVTFTDVTYGGPFGGDPFPIPGTGLFTVGDGVGGADTSGPILVGINSIAPNPVDITGGGQNIIVNFDVSDNSSGFSFGSIQVYNSNGNFVDSQFFDLSDEISSSGPLSGTYQVTIPIPQYGPPGTWELNFNLNDNAGNERDYPFNTAFPNPGDEMFTVTNTGLADTTDPVVNSVTITPGTIDTSTAAQTINVSVDATDDLSGLRWVFLYVYDPTDTAQAGLFQAITGGGATSGPFARDIEIPQGSTEGTWEIGVFLRDMAGNWIRYGLNGTLPFPIAGANEFVVGPAGPSSTYDNFASSFSLTGLDALPSANPDKDLFNNVLELLLGLDPTMPDLANPAIFGTSDTGTELQLNFTIDPSLTVAVSGDQLEVSDATGSPFMLTGQTGSNLVNDWANQLPANTGGSSYRVSTPIIPGTNGNIRLEFTVP